METYDLMTHNPLAPERTIDGSEEANLAEHEALAAEAIGSYQEAAELWAKAARLWSDVAVRQARMARAWASLTLLLATFGLVLLLVSTALAAPKPPSSRDCNDQPAPSLSVKTMQQRTNCRAYRDGRSMAAEFGLDLTNWGPVPRSCHLMAGPPEPGELGRGMCIGYVTLNEDEGGDFETDWHCSAPMVHALERDEHYGSVVHTWAGAPWRCTNDDGSDSHNWPSSDHWKPRRLLSVDPHGPYWNPCAHRTCPGSACVGSPDGTHTVCSQPAGSAGPRAHRHQPRSLMGVVFRPGDRRRIKDRLVAVASQAGRRVIRPSIAIIDPGPTGDGRSAANLLAATRNGPDCEAFVVWVPGRTPEVLRKDVLARGDVSCL